MIHIVDASVAVKWFLEEEEGKQEALSVLDAIKAAPQKFAVPELFFNEMLAVLCRLEAHPNSVAEAMESLQDLGMERLGNGRVLLAKAVEFAAHHKLSGYDAVYVANAVLIKGAWITADAAAHKKIKALNISSLLSDRNL